MTTPIDPDTRIAELRHHAFGNGLTASTRFCEDCGTLFDDPLSDVGRCYGRRADKRVAALASELAEKLRKAGDSHCALLELLSAADDRTRAEEKALAETKRELEQERELRSAALAYLHNLETMWEGYEGTASPGERRTVLTILNKTCIALGDTAPSPHPPLPACKRCGKPVAHPAQEYCGAACSVERGRAVEQPAPEGAVCRVCGHLNVACWCEAGKAREGSE